mmetsp:Transcript_90390/g.269699  ORF Transcript_90390/g.269699 Transcript_90390/m.269699 type:complete len:238 (-) Transcript_90390:537-1250(-)
MVNSTRCVRPSSVTSSWNSRLSGRAAKATGSGGSSLFRSEAAPRLSCLRTSSLPLRTSSMIRAARPRTGCRSVLLLAISCRTFSNGRFALRRCSSSTTGAKSTRASTGRSASVLNFRMASRTPSFLAFRRSADRVAWAALMASRTTAKSMTGLALRRSLNFSISSSTGAKSMPVLSLGSSCSSLAFASAPFRNSANTGEGSSSVRRRRTSAKTSAESVGFSAFDSWPTTWRMSLRIC